MPTATIPIVTEVGRVAAVTAGGLGLNITHIALGASAYAPAVNGTGHATQTALVDRREKRVIDFGTKVGAVLTIVVVFPASLVTAYNVGEIGFYAGDPDAGGVLFAVLSNVGRAEPARGVGAGMDYQQTFTITLTGTAAGNVNVTYDSGSGVALAALAAHNAAADPHTQYVLGAGDTMTGSLTVPGLNVSGGSSAVLTGPLVAAGAGSFGGPVTLPGNAAGGLQAMPLQQLWSSFVRSLGANGYFKIPISSTQNIVVMWMRVTATDVPAGAGANIPLTYPLALNALMAIYCSTVGEALGAKATIRGPGLTGCHVNVQEWDLISQPDFEVHVLVLGFEGAAPPSIALPDAGFTP